MRLLLDECVPQRLRKAFDGHEALTVAYLGWKGKQNGELIALMKAHRLAVLVTTDQNLPHQQNLHAAGIAVVVLCAPSNQPADLLRLIPSALKILGAIQPGQIEFIRQ